MKTVKIYTFFAGLALFTSCEKFLDKQPPHNLTLENAVTNYAGAKNLLNGMYTTVQNKKLGGDYVMLFSSMSGLYTATIHADNTAAYTMSYRQGKTEYSDRWMAMYAAVNAANATVTAISSLEENKFPGGLTEKKAMVAEAKTYRAWNYANLLWTRCHWWADSDSPYGLIYRDKMSNLSNLKVPRLTVGESYAKLFEDLDDAIANGPEYRSAKYLSKEMAIVLKAKLLLYRGKGNDYKDALALVQSVKSKAYIEPNIKKLYEDAWDSKEVLWARYKETPGRSLDDYNYAAGLITSFKFNADYGDDWLKTDPRYPQVTGMVRSGEAWDTESYLTFNKLTKRGKIDGPEDKYTAYYFRWSELYLMEAELIARSGGSVQDALKPLNELRSAKISVVFPILAATNLNDFYDLLFKEIWVELALENGSEWFASLRFMKDGKPWVYSLKKDVNFNENLYCWPIPDAEIVNNGLVFQNPDLK